MSKDIDTVQKVAGCGAALFGLLASPLWYFLLYQILTRVEASTAMWVCYWTYVPVAFAGSLLGSLLKMVTGEKA